MIFLFKIYTNNSFESSNVQEAASNAAALYVLIIYF